MRERKFIEACMLLYGLSVSDRDLIRGQRDVCFDLSGEV